MSIELKIPEIGESITEVIIGEWLKQEGESVERDEDIVVVESDKASMELPAPESGKLVKVLKRNGETAAVGEAIARLESEESETSESTDRPPKQEVTGAGGIAEKDREEKPRSEEAPGQEEEPTEKETKKAEKARPTASEKQTEDKSTQAKSAKATEKTQAEDDNENVEKADVEQGAADPQETPDLSKQTRDDRETRKAQTEERGTAESGRPKPVEIEFAEQEKEARKKESETKEPSEATLRPKIISREQTPEDRKTGVSEHRTSDKDSPDKLATRTIGGEEKIIPMTPIRRRIAERLVEAQQTTAFLSTFNEIDLSSANAIREEYQEEFRKKHEVKLGIMPFFVKATIEALKLIPQVNAEIQGTNIVYRNYYNIGVAIGGGKGLIVPVLRRAEKMSFAEVEQAIQEFARKAESNQIKPEDLEGGTFTISNGGIYGSLLSTPIINPPQSGILGMHAIQERPVVRDGQVVIRPMMYVAMTYDHRIVDGREAVTFLKRIKECIEAPSRVLLGI